MCIYESKFTASNLKCFKAKTSFFIPDRTRCLFKGQCYLPSAGPLRGPSGLTLFISSTLWKIQAGSIHLGKWWDLNEYFNECCMNISNIKFGLSRKQNNVTYLNVSKKLVNGDGFDANIFHKLSAERLCVSNRV